MINSATFLSAVISPLTMRDFESHSVDSIPHSSSCLDLCFRTGWPFTAGTANSRITPAHQLTPNCMHALLETITYARRMHVIRRFAAFILRR
jgi:hypothetical protein